MENGLTPQEDLALRVLCAIYENDKTPTITSGRVTEVVYNLQRKLQQANPDNPIETLFEFTEDPVLRSDDLDSTYEALSKRQPPWIRRGIASDRSVYYVPQKRVLDWHEQQKRARTQPAPTA